jgi:hypothetical protein
MSSALSTLSTFFFAWIALYLFLRLIHAAWIVTKHVNRLVSFGFRSRGPGGSLDAALKSAMKLMGWSSVVVLPVGIISCLALVFR